MSFSAAAIASPQEIARYEAVIGLEVHVQLGTRTKIFCGCPTGFGVAPNTNVCPVCLGLPGALPVLNKQAVEMAIASSLSMHCKVNSYSRFARKNYFYPDLPKGYQISQYDQPLAEHGWLEIGDRRIGITRVHMEDDAGKSIHDGFKDSDRYSYVDLNRSGTPLIEIVTDPDLHTSDEAHAFLTELKMVIQYGGISECDMEKGQLRCDANVSVRLKGVKELGTKAEVKNLNSFRFAKIALDYEIARQVAVIEGGGKVAQETRSFNAATGETASMRSKEHAHDYRYFPEPDLTPLRISDEWRERIAKTLPELPADKRARFIRDYGVREYDAQVLTQTRELSDYFEGAAKVSGDGKTSANWVLGDLLGTLKGTPIVESPVSAERLGELVSLIAKGEISGKLAKDIFAKMFAGGETAAAIIEREGLKQINDTGALGQIVDDVIAANSKQVEQYKAGKTTVLGFLVGQVMKASKGQANPGAVNELLRERLS
jgi:aspartyl-tRNA(Asn)/glutamyl-tRNA(Gln) amidotransferase subunit B